MHCFCVLVLDGVCFGEHCDGGHCWHWKEKINGNLQPHSGFKRSANCKKRWSYRPRCKGLFINYVTKIQWKTFSGGFLGQNKFIFFVNYFYSKNKLLMLMAMFSQFYLVDLGYGWVPGSLLKETLRLSTIQPKYKLYIQR